MANGLTFGQEPLGDGVLLVRELPKMPLPVHDRAAVVAGDPFERPSVRRFEHDGDSGELPVHGGRPARVLEIQPSLHLEGDGECLARRGRRRHSARSRSRLIAAGMLPSLRDASTVDGRVQTCPDDFGPFAAARPPDQLVQSRSGGLDAILELPAKVERPLARLVPQFTRLHAIGRLYPAGRAVNANRGSGLHVGELYP